MKKVIFSTCCLLMFLISACQKDEPMSSNAELDQHLEEALNTLSNGAGKSFFVLPESDDFSNIPQDPKNPLTKDKVELGKLLYHETGLAMSPMNQISMGKFSCASCHFASAGFQAGRQQGISEGGIGFGINGEARTKSNVYLDEMVDVQPMRSPTTLNSAYQELMLWNGQFGAGGMNVGTEANWTPGTPKETNNLGFEGLETQAIAGLGVHRLVDNEAFITSTPVYKSLFDVVFADLPESERYQPQQVGLAIAAYERTLLANQAPFQQWLKGDDLAMTDEEKRGAILFFDDARCGSCHTGPALNKMEFHAVGMKDLFDCPLPVINVNQAQADHLGRGGFTGNQEDNYKFKVPQLYNLEDSPFFGHGSSFNSIEDVVNYFNKANPENSKVPQSQLAEMFVPLNLTQTEVKEITAFIKTSLRDNNLKRYEPSELPSGNCFPFADPLAASQLGCD